MKRKILIGSILAVFILLPIAGTMANPTDENDKNDQHIEQDVIIDSEPSKKDSFYLRRHFYIGIIDVIEDDDRSIRFYLRNVYHRYHCDNVWCSDYSVLIGHTHHERIKNGYTVTYKKDIFRFRGIILTDHFIWGTFSNLGM